MNRNHFRRGLAAALGVCLVMGLASCGQKTAPPAAPAVTVDLRNYETLRETYLAPVFSAGMLTDSWESPDEIDPESFSLFYSVMIGRGEVRLDYEVDEVGDPIVPAILFEEAIAKYFELSPAQLQQSPRYDPEARTYTSAGLGGASDCRVVGAAPDGDRLTLDFEIVSDDAEVAFTGKLGMTLASDGGWKYTDCESTLNEAILTAADKFIRSADEELCGEIFTQAYAVFHEKRSGYDSAAELSSDELFNFFLNFYEQPDDFYHEDTKTYVFPITAITALLDRYFEGYTFDIGKVTLNLSVADGVVTLAGFAGSDPIKSIPVLTELSYVENDCVLLTGNNMDLDIPDKIVGTASVTIRVTDDGYHILSLENFSPLGHFTDPADTKALGASYVFPLCPRASTALRHSWANAGELTADELVDFCSFNNLTNQPLKQANRTIYQWAEFADENLPAAALETAVQQYFDVSAAYLQTSSYYDAAKNSYRLRSDFNGGTTGGVTEAKREGDLLILTTALYEPQDTSLATVTGVLTVRVAEGKIQYLSYAMD